MLLPPRLLSCLLGSFSMQILNLRNFLTKKSTMNFSSCCSGSLSSLILHLSFLSFNTCHSWKFMVKKLQITYKIQFSQCITDQIESNLRITLEAKTLERFEARLMHYDRAWPTWNLIKAFISSKLPLVDYACGIIFKCHFRIIKIHFIADLILFRFFHEIVGFQNGLIDMLWMLIKLSIASLESFQSIDLFLWHVLHPTTVSVRKLSWLFTSLSAILLLLFLLILFDASLPARRIVNGIEWFFCSCQFCFSFSVL